jgi:hypothetical protein
MAAVASAGLFEDAGHWRFTVFDGVRFLVVDRRDDDERAEQRRAPSRAAAAEWPASAAQGVAR